MSNLLIEGDVADQLRDLAERQHMTVEAALKSLLERYSDSEPSTTLARLAETLNEGDFHSGQSDTATRSREILETEYADYLINRKRGQEDA